MNLKEAFRYQNKLRELMNEGFGILSDARNITETKTLVFKSRVDPESEDEVVISDHPSEYANDINSVVRFLMYLMDTLERLSESVRRAKIGIETDIDGGVGLNRDRQKFAMVLRNMVNTKNGERNFQGAGRGYRFNSDGNQVAYVCDSKMITTINFDRTYVRSACSSLSAAADEVSRELDSAIVNTEVDGTVEFDVNDSFAEVFEMWLNNHAEKKE